MNLFVPAVQPDARGRARLTVQVGQAPMQAGLEKATRASRYEAPQFPHMNLGRVYEHRGEYQQALAAYDQALALDPFYRTAIWAKYEMLGRLN